MVMQLMIFMLVIMYDTNFNNNIFVYYYVFYCNFLLFNGYMEYIIQPY